MVDKIHTIVATEWPSEAPPSIGCHYMYSDAIFFGTGTTNPEDWVQIRGAQEGVGFNAGATFSPTRMQRLIAIDATGEAGPTAPVTTLEMPAWGGLPHGFAIDVTSVAAGVTVPIDLDFSALGNTNAFGFQGDVAGVTATQDGNVLKLLVTDVVRISFDYLEWQMNESSAIVGIYLTLRVTPNAYVAVEGA
jgi:hypothetical protein